MRTIDRRIFAARGLTPSAVKELHDVARSYGFRRGTSDPDFITSLNPAMTLWFYLDDKNKIDHSDNSIYEAYSQDQYHIYRDHVTMFHRWAKVHNIPTEHERNRNNKQQTDKPIEQPMIEKAIEVPATPAVVEPQPQQHISNTPYELMIGDICNRVEAKLRNNLVDETTVRELVLKELATQKRLTIVVEDRRKQPIEEKEIKDPVHKMLPELLGILQSECWAAIVGPTGGGKTLGALQCASKILGIELICCKQLQRMMAPHELIGYKDAGGRYNKGVWTDAIIGYVYDDPEGKRPTATVDNPAIIILDEMDNGNENINMLVKGLQTGLIAMPYGMQQVNKRLYVVATMNTWGQGATREYVGRCAQDAALLNEFQFIEWNYDTEFEWELLQKCYYSFKSPGDYTIIHMRQLMDMFIAMRNKAEKEKIRVIISTRNVINVAKMLLTNPKWTIHSVLCKSVYKGLKEEEIKRVECPEHWTKRASKGAAAEVSRGPLNNIVGKLNLTDADDGQCPI